MSAEPAKKPSKTLAEKAQHLQPIDITAADDAGACGQQTCSKIAGDHDIANAVVEQSCTSNQDRNSQLTEHDGAECCATVNKSDEDVNELPVKSTNSNTCTTTPHGNFKLGAESSSIDLEDVFINARNVTPDGFLSPTSPTSPTSPDPDGSRSPRKSSMRDPSRPRTPPGTPHRKSVRFADALGLDLETVKTILRTESPPDLNVHVDEDKQTISAKVLSLCFQQPGGRPDFISRLNSLNVCLENVIVHEFTLIGTIKVRNLGFDKEVRIRQSSDNWSSYVDTMAMYVQGSYDGPTDRFSFGLSGPRSMAPGAILSFAIYYKVAGNIFWDNNGGQNYSLVCEEVNKVQV